jgi:head-tail adaptor
MTRRILILLAAIIIGIGAALFSRTLLHKSPSNFLRDHYGANTQQAERIATLENDYQAGCKSLCDAMCMENSELENQISSSESVTPAIIETIEKSDRIRSQARISMLKHCFAVAAELPPERRKEYLKKMTPLAVDPRCCDDK